MVEQGANMAIFDEKSIDIIRCYKNNPEIAVKDVAKQLGWHVQTVYKHIKRPHIAEAIREIKGSVEEIILDAQRLAAKRIKRLIMSDNESIALKATTEVLKPRLHAEQTTHAPISFVTVVNEVGVLETTPQHDVVDVIPQVPDTKPTH